MSIHTCSGDQWHDDAAVSRTLPILLAGMSLFTGIAALPTSAAKAPGASACRYVVPECQEPSKHPPLRAVPLSDQKPADLEESVEYRGMKRRYAELRLGTPTSKPVAVVVDIISSREFDLYVNASRDRTIFPEDRVTGSGPRFRAEVDVQQVDGLNIQSTPRTVRFRVGRAGRSLSYAIAGYTEGTIVLGGQSLKARRMDADGNGGMADETDLIWIDLNDDAQWDPFTERFPFAPVLKLAGERYAVAADWLGERLSLKTLAGSGTLRLTLAAEKPTAPFAKIHAYLAGRDGSLFRLEGLSSTATVPVGEYRIYELAVVAEDPAGGAPWAFFFGEAPGQTPSGWHWVERDQSVDLDPLAGMVLTAEVTPETPSRLQPGDMISVQTSLTTAGGLRLNGCSRSTGWDPARESGARIRLIATSGAELDSATAGFS